MTDSRAQSNYQVRLGWGAEALSVLAKSGIVVVVDAIDTSEPASATAAAAAPTTEELVAQAAALPHAPTVFRASLRNATATAKAAYEEQVARGGRTAINLVLAGGGGLGAGAVSSAGAFAVEDYLAAGAIGNALSALGIDHSAPDVAVATEGFRPLTRALKHLLSASASGLALIEAGRRDEVKAAAELDAEPEAARLAH